MIIRYAVPEMWLETDDIVIFILGNFYPFTPPISPKNGNFKKMKKNNNIKKKTKKKQTNKTKQNLEVSLFYTSVQKIMITCYAVPEIYGA